MSKMIFAFRTFTPVTSLLMMFFFMQTTECVFAVIARTGVENVGDALGFGGVADGTIAAFGLHKQTLLSTETTVGT